MTVKPGVEKKERNSSRDYEEKRMPYSYRKFNRLFRAMKHNKESKIKDNADFDILS